MREQSETEEQTEREDGGRLGGWVRWREAGVGRLTDGVRELRWVLTKEGGGGCRGKLRQEEGRGGWMGGGGARGGVQGQAETGGRQGWLDGGRGGTRGGAGAS